MRGFLRVAPPGIGTLRTPIDPEEAAEHTLSPPFVEPPRPCRRRVGEAGFESEGRHVRAPLRPHRRFRAGLCAGPGASPKIPSAPPPWGGTALGMECAVGLFRRLAFLRDAFVRRICERKMLGGLAITVDNRVIKIVDRLRIGLLNG